jgi:hypothetical protein
MEAAATGKRKWGAETGHKKNIHKWESGITGLAEFQIYSEISLSLFYFIFLAALGFELRASCLLRHSTT